jgi:manganese/zinc/iron transport system substrate-binding protein
MNQNHVFGLSKSRPLRLVRRPLAAVGLLTFGFLSGVLSGCGPGSSEKPGAPSEPGDGSKRITIVCTTTMIADLAGVIAGDDAEVVGIMKAGEDPHVYEMRPRDTQAIARADLVLMNGLHLEAQIDHVVENHAKGRVVRLAETEKITPLGTDEVAGAPDPHCWFNVEYFIVFVERACDAMAEVDPTHADAYRSRAAAYIDELKTLHTWAGKRIAEIPRERRIMVTSHDAFAYLGSTYDIEVHAVIGMSTEQQPTGRDKIALQELVSERGAKAVFIETSVSAALNDMVRQIAEATGAKIGGTLYSDSLGDPATPEGTYLGMFRHNIDTLVEALR